jgi:hypothetical protein
VVVANPRNLSAKASITDITAEVENDQQESVMKLAQAHEMLAKIIHSALHKDLQLLEKSTRWVTKMLYEEMKKGKSESVCGDQGDDRSNFLKILYSILTIGETARVKNELAGLTLTQETL